jgi:outer membrane lipoprotein-sorting protein
MEVSLMNTVKTMMLLLVLPGLMLNAALADDKDDLISAMTKSHDAESYRIRWSSDEDKDAGPAVMEFQKPDRFRVITEDAEMIAAGGAVHVVVDGQMMRIPMDASNLVGGYRADVLVHEDYSKITITAVQRESLNGEQAIRYDFTVDAPPSSNRIWVSQTSGYLLRMEQTTGSGRRQSTATFDYEDFGKVTISVP